MTKITPDEKNPLSQGFVCVKGVNAADVLYDPSRVLHPVRRRDGGWDRSDWDTAIADIGARLGRIIAETGPNSVAFYLGNPSAMSAVTVYVAQAFQRALGSSRRYSSMSLDNMNKFVVAEAMFGDKSFILQRDWANADTMIVLGHNPRVSIFGQLSSRPRGLADVRAAQSKGGRLILVDPRRSESAMLADEHLRITPGTDTYFLLALLNVMVAEDLHDAAFIDRYCANFERLCDIVAPFTPSRVAAATGINAETIQRIARDFARSDAGFVLGNTGVTQQRLASVNEWAIVALNAITGNIDRTGGAYYNPGVVDEPRPKTAIEWDRPSRVRGYPRILGEYPVATLADEILTPGDGQVRALIVAAGNPAATAADVVRLREAFASLDLLVVIDVKKSATAQYADWLLPATTFLERKDINIGFTRHTPFPFVQYTEAVVAPCGEAREEWQIFRDLHRAMGLPFLGRTETEDPYEVDDFFADFLSRRGQVGLEELKTHPHGLQLGEVPIGAFRELLDRRGSRIELAPDAIVRLVPAADRIDSAATQDFPMLLISRRNLRSLCSWLHQGDEAAPVNDLELNPSDAAALGLADKGAVQVVSRTGVLRASVRITDSVDPGVVSLQFGFPSGGSETMNVLVDAVEDCDEITGMPTFNGIPVRLERCD